MAQTLTAAQVQYQHYLQSPRWRLIRFLRLHLDGKRCHGRITRTRLQVHHTTYANKGGSFWAELGDLVTLCDSCHAKRHGKTPRQGA